jgi:hippurate hydrolase
MLQVKPGAYLRLGQGGEGSCFLHNSRYDFNDEVLPLGAALFATLAQRSLAPAARQDDPTKDSR